MGATLSQPFIPLPSRNIKIKSKRPRFRFRFRFRIRWKRKRTLPEIRALFPPRDYQCYRESKLYDSSCTEGEEKSPLSDSYTFTSASSSAVPTSPVAVAEKGPGAGLDSLNKSPSVRGTSPSRSDNSPESPQHLIPCCIPKEKPLPRLPEPPLPAPAPAPVHHTSMRTQQETKTQTNTSACNELQSRVSQANGISHGHMKQENDEETEHDTSDSDFPPLHRCPPPISPLPPLPRPRHSPSSSPCPSPSPSPVLSHRPARPEIPETPEGPARPERPHTPPPWDTSLSGYGSILEVSRPFRARRVFEHPLVEGHFWRYKGEFLGGNRSGSGAGSGDGSGPIAAEEKRRRWREWRELQSRKGKGEGECGVRDGKEKKKEKGIEREKGMGMEKSRKTKAKRMSEWRRWKPLPRYPACTGVAQRASTWAVTGDRAWIEVVEEAEDQEYQGGDEKEEDKEKDEDEEGEDGEDGEDLEEAIKSFLEIKIPVDLNSLRRLRTSFAGTGEHTTTTGSGTGEAAGGEAGEEDLEKAMEGEQGQLSPLVESLMFTDTDIEGFEFLFEEEDEGGGIWDSGIVVGVESGRVDGKGEVCKMNGPIGGFAGGDASRAEVSEEDTGHKVRRAFSATQRLSRWKEKK